VIEDILVRENTTLLLAMDALSKSTHQVVFIVNKRRKFLGTLTDGDVRRHILKTRRLDDKVSDVYNKNSVFVYVKDINKAELISKDKQVRAIPILNNNGEVVDVYRNDQISRAEAQLASNHPHKETPVVVMAGGIGSRMKPFTNVFPKPLLPIGETTTLDLIIESFEKFSLSNFFLMLGYKSNLIKAYVSANLADKKIITVTEDHPRGTAGSLHSIKGLLDQEKFIVINCDTIVELDFIELLKFHECSGSVATIVTATKTFTVPFGSCELDEHGCLQKLTEKPTNSYLINVGCYVFNKSVLNYVELSGIQDMDDLLNKIINSKQKISVFPISSNAWKDVGEWKNYSNSLDLLG